jgi:phosphohistidine swiveling domain-containing protein
LRRRERVVDLERVADPGSKARNLVWLRRRGALVPQTWLVDSPEDAASLGLPSGDYAVRSSSPEEDTKSEARAGRYLTELGIPAAEVSDAVARVLSSAAPDPIAVMIQPMVAPVLSGVAFSRNPVTGLSDTIVEAIEGSGEALLQEGSDPMRWVFRHGELLEAPMEDENRELIEQVASETQRLAARYGPADLEWVWDGNQLYWVQIRPITTIEEVPIYSRRIAKDVMPGMIKPLVWSVNVPMVNKAWVRLFTEAIGPNDLDANSLARSFAYRSYFDMRAIGDIFELTGMPRDSLENLLGLPGSKGRMRPGLGALLKLPRLMRTILRLAFGTRRTSRERDALHHQFRTFDSTPVERMSDEDLLEEIEQLVALGEKAAYVNIVVPLLANVHMRALKKRAEKAGISIEDHPMSPKPESDPIPLLRRLGASLSALDPATLEGALEGDIHGLADQIESDLAELLTRFGHLSANVNDISTPHWRDDPTQVLKLALAARREPGNESEPLEGIVKDVRGLSGWRLRRALKRARMHALLREAVGSTYSYGYGLLRPRFLEIGARLVSAGLLDEAADVFYLPRNVAENALLGDSIDLRPKVAAEKESMARVEDTVMPDLIVGDSWLPEPDHVAGRLEGVGVSHGSYRGLARYIPNLDKAHLLNEGDVLVVEHSDVAWTPLFARAGAVVTAAGGLLAHSSITAREMGVPCVASVSRARLLDGLTVLVDGFEGLVFVEEPGASSSRTA